MNDDFDDALRGPEPAASAARAVVGLLALLAIVSMLLAWAVWP